MLLTYLPESERIHCKAEERYEYLALKKWFARRREGYMFDPRFKLKLWDGYTHAYDTTTDTVELGLWKEIVKMCQEFGYPFKFTNKEEFPINRDVKKAEAIKWMQSFLQDNAMDEREYQLRVASNILKDRYCNVAVATSGGKTFIFSLVLFWLMANGHSDKKFLLVVPSKTLVTQFYDDILKYNNGRFDLNIQEIYGEEPRITDNTREPNLVIATFQSLAGETAVGKKDKNKPEKKLKKIAKYDKAWFQQFWSVSVDECLHPDSLIRMADNTFKLIKNIQIGEFVKTINEVTGIVEDKRVEFVYKNLNKQEQIYEIEIDNGSILKLTGNHKINTKNRGWIRTDQLNTDDDIICFNI